MVKNKSNKLLWAGVILLPIIGIIITVFIGRYYITPKEVIKIFSSLISGSDMSTMDSEKMLIISEIRLPRAITAVLVGASLAVSGAAFQGLFCNPLVNSGILGVSSGAGFGAALAIVMFGQGNQVFLFAFFFGCVAVGMSYMTGRAYGVTSTIMLVLGGTVISAVFSALISFIKYVADPYSQLPSITFWLMGSLASVSSQTAAVAAIPMVIGTVGIFIMRWRINVLSMGDREAQALGISVGFSKAVIIGCATLATAGAVCISGIIGWVGLIIPHMARMIMGSDNRYIIPVSISFGAVFMLIVDSVARTLTSSEIPIGIITAILGGPFFIYLLKRTKGGGW